MIIRNIPLDDKWEFKSDLFRSVNLAFCGMIAHKINEKEEKMKADSITSPIRKQGFRASMTVKW